MGRGGEVIGTTDGMDRQTALLELHLQRQQIPTYALQSTVQVEYQYHSTTVPQY